MEIKSFNNGVFGATTYLIYDSSSKEGALIDCTCSTDEITKIIEELKINLKYILITHGHFDHVYCLSKMKEIYPRVQVLIHKDDVSLLNQVGTQCSMAGFSEIKVPCIDGLLDNNTKNLTLGKEEIKIIHTKGHSQGGVCYLIGDLLFSGDTLFKGSIGRCDLFGGDFSQIEDSIKNKLFKLDDNIIVYPGHGARTTIGEERRFNPYFGLEK